MLKNPRWWKGDGKLVATKNDIRAAYRMLLGREPDARGLRDHLEWVTRYEAHPSVLADRIMSSDEYRMKSQQGASMLPIDMGGHVVLAHPGDRLISAGVIADGNYEPHVIERFAQALHSGAYVLDVGANIGLYTMKAAAIAGEHGRVFAVEPLPQNHRALYGGIVRNGYSNVSVLPFAASDGPGLIPAICALDSSNGIVGVRSAGNSEEIMVPTQRLDDILATIPRLDVVKIDIEGHEPVAWRGMSALLQKHRPTVFSEFSPVAIRNVGNDPLEYLNMIFAYSSDVTVLRRDAGTVRCDEPQALMQEWHQANRAAGLDGQMHLDLLIAPRGRAETVN